MLRVTVKAFCWVVAIVSLPVLRQQTLAGQQVHILHDASVQIQKVEPDWVFTPWVCNFRGPLLSEQVGIDCGSWNPRDESLVSRDAVLVHLHVVSSAEAASRWMTERLKPDNSPQGWTTMPYEIGDGGYLATYERAETYEFAFRKARFLIFVGARAKMNAERFARRLASIDFE